VPVRAVYIHGHAVLAVPDHPPHARLDLRGRRPCRARSNVERAPRSKGRQAGSSPWPGGFAPDACRSGLEAAHMQAPKQEPGAPPGATERMRAKGAPCAGAAAARDRARPCRAAAAHRGCPRRPRCGRAACAAAAARTSRPRPRGGRGGAGRRAPASRPGTCTRAQVWRLQHRRGAPLWSPHGRSSRKALEALHTVSCPQSPVQAGGPPAGRGGPCGPAAHQPSATLLYSGSVESCRW